MPSAIHNVQTGEHITFLPDDGDVFRMRFVIDGGGLVAAEHLHPEQEERFEVVTGTLRMRLNGQEREVHAGERVVVPAGVPHAWWNTSPAEPAEVRIDLEPALESRAFFETLFQMVEDGHTRNGMPRNPVRLAVLAQRYDREVQGVPAEGDPLGKLRAPVLRGLVKTLALADRVFAIEPSRDSRNAASAAFASQGDVLVTTRRGPHPPPLRANERASRLTLATRSLRTSHSRLGGRLRHACSVPSMRASSGCGTWRLDLVRCEHLVRAAGDDRIQAWLSRKSVGGAGELRL